MEAAILVVCNGDPVFRCGRGSVSAFPGLNSLSLICIVQGMGSDRLQWGKLVIPSRIPH